MSLNPCMVTDLAAMDVTYKKQKIKIPQAATDVPEDFWAQGRSTVSRGNKVIWLENVA